MPEEMPDAIDTVSHEGLEDLAEDEDEGIDGDDTVGLDFV